MCCGFWLLIVWLMFGFVIVVACWLPVVGALLVIGDLVGGWGVACVASCLFGLVF